MATYTVYANNEGVVIDSYSRGRNFPVGNTVAKHTGETYLLCSMSLPPQQYRTKAISDVTLYVRLPFGSTSAGTRVAGLYSLRSDAAMEDRTFGNTTLSYSTGIYPTSDGSLLCSSYTEALPVINQNGFAIEIISKYSLYTQKSSYKPYAVYEFYDYEAGITPYTYGRSPERQYVDRSKPILFSWDVLKDRSIDALTVASTTFLWREGDNGTVHEVSVGAGETSCTLPANTLPLSDDIRWNIRITTANGATRTGSWRSSYDKLWTRDVLPSTPLTISPVSAIVDGSGPVELRWQHVISSGSAQGAAVVQVSQDGSTWTQLAQITGAAQTYTAPAGTFTSGTWYWRVKTANGDDAWSDWSAAAMLISVYAPDAPSVAIVSDAPAFAIRWAQTGQQSFEVRLDGVQIAAVFSTEGAYQYDGFIADGTHTVAVRIQNRYGLWSEWAQIALTVTNVPGDPITLTAVPDSGTPQTLLSWEANGSDRYMIYRDGALIGETAESSFTDRFGAGTVSYQVRGVDEDSGYYTMSGAVSVTVLPENPMIYDTEAKSWLSVRLSDNQSREFAESRTRAAAFYHFAGTAKPSVEFGEATDAAISFDAAFLLTDVDSQRAFEAMLGRVVCLKLPDGFSITGALTGYGKRHTHSYASYSASITETVFEEAAING